MLPIFHIDNVFTLQKAKDGQESEKTITVDMVANGLAPDKKSDEILKDAFDPETVAFHMAEGITDWHHMSDIRMNPQPGTCNDYILGKPIGFRWEKRNGRDVPIETSALTKAHPIVAGMIPHLEAGLPVYGASVGGDILKFQLHKAEGRKISKIHWTHTAITGRPYVISPGSAVMLQKAAGGQADLYYIPRIDYLSKALEAASPAGGTDIANRTGLPALQPQSIGEDEYIYNIPAQAGASVEISQSDWEALMDDFLEALKKGQFAPTEIGVIGYLQKNGFGPGEAIGLAKHMIDALAVAVTE